nr:NB-ARC domains-containing protein [Tanacetum cinerariifolium]
MTTEVANKLFEDVVDSLLAKAKKEIGYTWNCKENVEKLRSEVGKLKDMTGRVQQRIKGANDKGDKLLTGVERWVDEALALISTTEEFLREEASAKKTCFNLRMCVNVNTLHHYGKQATNKVPSLEEHQKDGVVYEGDVSIPTPSPGILELNQRKNYDELDTHKSALEKIVNSIEGESTQITGIYGIGGVGKTTLAKEVAARVKDLFALVVFVTVSQRVDATKIQKEVEAAAKRIMKDIDPDIRLAFANLKLSYDYLETEESKSCFLLCSMFPEDFGIPLERLSYYGVGLQVFEDLKSLEDARDRVQNAVELLKSSCLLLDGDDEFTTKMHDVVREGALLIASKDNNKYLVEAGKDLIEWEPRNESMESYTGISLMKNDIRKLPSSYELKIPLLDIFLIQDNLQLSEIS